MSARTMSARTHPASWNLATAASQSDCQSFASRWCFTCDS